MPRAAAIALCAAVAVCACSAPPPSPGRASAGETAPASPTNGAGVSTSAPAASDAPERPTAVPRPNAAIPRSPRRVADALEDVTGAVRRSVAVWIRRGDPSSWPPPRTLTLQALYQQRIYRDLARRRRWRSVVARLPISMRTEAEAIVRANGAVFAHAHPVPPSYPIRTRAPEPADVLRAYFEEAERRFGVPWSVLAAVNYVETKFGRVVSNSPAGAQGPMQFLPSTWVAYGMGGDIRDPHDAILGAANYLHANGAPENIRGALFHYNPVDAYVDAVTSYASAMRRDPRLYYAMYCWQVYVLTTRGDQRVTGPGL